VLLFVSISPSKPKTCSAATAKRNRTINFFIFFIIPPPIEKHIARAHGKDGLMQGGLVRQGHF